MAPIDQIATATTAANRCINCGGTAIASNQCTACGYLPTRIEGFDAYAPELASGDEGFDASYHHSLATMEAGNFWFRARNHLILTALRRHAPDMRNMLEIGCGTGYVLAAIQRAYPNASLVGSELFVEGLRHAAERVPGASFIQMDARRIPYQGCFDVIGAFDVIEHVQQDEAVLREACNALSDGGLMLITVPQHRWLWSEQDRLAHHVRRYSRQELIGKVEAAGFRVIRATSFMTALLPLMLLSRRRGNTAHAGQDPFREFRIPGWVNAIFYAVMRTEVALVNAGVPLPIGGSLLLIARKGSSP